jgi:hypothetical protein
MCYYGAGDCPVGADISVDQITGLIIKEEEDKST